MKYLKTFEEKRDKFRVKIVKDWTLPDDYVKFKYTTNGLTWHYIHCCDYDDSNYYWSQYKVSISSRTEISDLSEYLNRFSTLDKIKEFEEKEWTKLERGREEIKRNKQKEREKEKDFNKKLKDINKK